MPLTMIPNFASSQLEAKLLSTSAHSGYGAREARKRAKAKARILFNRKKSSMANVLPREKRTVRRVKSAGCGFGLGQPDTLPTAENRQGNRRRKDESNNFTRQTAYRSKSDSACMPGAQGLRQLFRRSAFSFKKQKKCPEQELRLSWHSDADKSPHAPRLPQRRKSNDFGLVDLPPVPTRESNSLHIKYASDHHVGARSNTRRIPSLRMSKPLSDRTLVTLDNHSSFTSNNHSSFTTGNHSSMASMEYSWPGHAAVVDEPPETNSPRKPRRRLSNENAEGGSEIANGMPDKPDSGHSTFVFEDPHQLLMKKTKPRKNPKVESGAQSFVSSISDECSSNDSSESTATFASAFKAS